MTEKRKHQILAEINRQIEAKNISQNEFAAYLDISPANLSLLRNQKWELIADKMWHKIANKVMPTTDWQIDEEAYNFVAFTKACKTARTQKKPVLIAAYTGAGKTTALLKYHRATENTYYVHCESTWGQRDLVINIARAVGITGGGKTTELIETIAAKLGAQEQALLIIDSLHRLNKTNTLEFVGDLLENEKLENKVGFVLAGTEALVEKLNKGVFKNKAGYAELDRRIYTKIQSAMLPQIHKDTETVNSICLINGIEDPTQQYQVANGFTASNRNEFLGVAKNYGDINKRVTYFQIQNKKAQSNE